MRFIETVASSVWSTLVFVFLAGGAAVIASRFLFGMSVSGAIAFYLVVWWLCLFVLLPIGICSQSEQQVVVPGTDPGAPITPRIRERAILTTLLSDIVFLASAMLLPLAGL